MEEIAEGIFRTLGSIIRWLLWHLLYEMILFNLGRIILLIISLGRYPRGRAVEKDTNLISWVGISTLLLIWAGIAIYNNWLS